MRCGARDHSYAKVLTRFFHALSLCQTVNLFDDDDEVVGPAAPPTAVSPTAVGQAAAAAAPSTRGTGNDRAHALVFIDDDVDEEPRGGGGGAVAAAGGWAFGGAGREEEEDAPPRKRHAGHGAAGRAHGAAAAAGDGGAGGAGGAPSPAPPRAFSPASQPAPPRVHRGRPDWTQTGPRAARRNFRNAEELGLNAPLVVLGMRSGALSETHTFFDAGHGLIVEFPFAPSPPQIEARGAARVFHARSAFLSWVQGTTESNVAFPFSLQVMRAVSAALATNEALAAAQHAAAAVAAALAAAAASLGAPVPPAALPRLPHPLRALLAESPTGCGKTLALLAPLLAHQARVGLRGAPEAVPRVFVVTRTLAQLDHVMKEMRRLVYAPLATHLGGACVSAACDLRCG